jgi:hypothetical protein
MSRKTKEETIAILTERGIEFAADATYAELTSLLKDDESADEKVAEQENVSETQEPDIEEPRKVTQNEIQLERRVRRYIRPDGLFRKGLSKQQQAEGKIFCERSGRKVALDSEQKRLKATPGWNNAVDTRKTPEQMIKEKAR